MSYTELHIGKIKKVDLQNKSVGEWAKEIAKEAGVGLEENYYDSYKELILNEFCKEYIIVENEVYEIIEDNEFSDDIDILTPEGNNMFSFTMQFYNGSTCLAEMLEYAIKQYNNGR